MNLRLHCSLTIRSRQIPFRRTGRTAFPERSQPTVLPNEANGDLGRMGRTNGRDLPRNGFPERSQFGRRTVLPNEANSVGAPFSQTKPTVISGGWVKKAGEIAPESTSQTNPLTRSDVLSSEIERYSARGAFPKRSQFGRRTVLPNEANGDLGRIGRTNGRDLPRNGFPKRTH
jgi:hypothetical protein